MHRFTTGSSRALCLQAPNSEQGLPHLRNSVHMAVQMWVQVSTAAWKQLAIRPLLQSFLYFMGKEIVLLWEPRVWKVYKILSKACIPNKTGLFYISLSPHVAGRLFPTIPDWRQQIYDIDYALGRCLALGYSSLLPSQVNTDLRIPLQDKVCPVVFVFHHLLWIVLCEIKIEQRTSYWEWTLLSFNILTNLNLQFSVFTMSSFLLIS